MTELMKRYEAETGKKALGGTIPTLMYVFWLEAQLTWRPVSEEPTLKEMGKILCKNNDMKISVELWGIALEDWEDFVKRLNIVSWLPIPPALEV